MQDAPQQRVQNKPGLRGWVTAIAMILGLFTGLCTLFALVVTTAQAWEEHTHAQWPETTAQVQRCDMHHHMGRTESYWIDCSVSYQVRGEEFVSHVHSASTPAPRHVLGRNPSAQFDLLQNWIGAHPQGTSIRIHYDPANHSDAVLPAETDMPLAGPRTPDNLKLLAFFGVSFIVMVTLAGIARPRPAAARA